MSKKYSRVFSLLVMVLSVFSLLSSMFVSPNHSHAANIGDKATVKEAIFMLGPPAAGKSHARKKTYPNYAVIDPDELKKKAWLSLQKQYKQNPNSTVIVQGETHKLSEYENLLMENYEETNTIKVELTHILSKTLSKEAYESAIKKNDSFVYDTTGGNVERMKREMLEAKKHGFKIVLVNVFAPLKVCLERNAKRDRSVPEHVVKRIWNEVQVSWNQLKNLPTVDAVKEVNTSI